MLVEVSEQCLEHQRCLIHINYHFYLNTWNGSGEKLTRVHYGAH